MFHGALSPSHSWWFSFIICCKWLICFKGLMRVVISHWLLRELKAYLFIEIKPAELLLCCLFVHECRVIYRSMVSFSGAALVKKTNSIFSRSQTLSIVLSQGVRLSVLLPLCMLGFCLAWTWIDLMHKFTISLSSYVQLSCCALKTMFLLFF